LPLGIIAGGHIDGSVSIWNAAQVLSENKEGKTKTNFGCISIKKFHDIQVNDLKFNPFKSNLLASCGRDIYVHNIDKLSLSDPLKCSNLQPDSEMTSLNWNDKVQYILASATSSGRIFIWDMRKQAATVQIYDQYYNDNQRHLKTTVMWYPENPVQVVIAYDDPEMNYLHLYDIRQPTAPCGEFYGSPSRSIFEVSSNPNDNSLLLTTGRDNIVTCWNMKTVNLY
jgi:protein transport protein SEC31